MRGINEKGQFLGKETECKYRGVIEHTQNGYVEHIDVTCSLPCLVMCQNPRTADKNCKPAQGYDINPTYRTWPQRARNINSLN